jgi:membrane-bound ClpP family serine protease
MLSLDDIAIGIALILILYYHIDLDWCVYMFIFLFLAGVLAVKLYIFYPHFRKPFTGAEGMIGLSGETLEVLNPYGQVKIRGEIWNAKSLEGVVNKGEKVEILDIEGLEVLVRPVKK